MRISSTSFSVLLAAFAALAFVAGHVSGVLRSSHLEQEPQPAARHLAAIETREHSSPSLPFATELTSQEERDISIFKTTKRSVVYISNIALRRDFFSVNVMEIPRGTGSGFVWDESGHIVTNFHVIEGGNRFAISFDGEVEHDAELVGIAPQKDLAVLRISEPPADVTPIPLGHSAPLQVGQRVLAIGNPFGLDHSLTVGVVSALGRELQSPGGLPIRNVIQSDAAINPGNSGGPLLDSSGRLIGVNTAIFSPSGASAGIGFAVPVDTVRRLVPQLIEHGRPIRPGIGMELVEDRLARRYVRTGLIIRRVTPGGPAASVGLEGIKSTRRGASIGDVIVAVDGIPVRSIDQLILAFEDIGVGGTARLSVRRDGRERDVAVELVALD